MKFTISRSSDQFMNRTLPTPEWKPYKHAKWDEKVGNWIIDLSSIKELLAIPSNREEKLILKHKSDFAHIEIDDLNDRL